MNTLIINGDLTDIMLLFAFLLILFFVFCVWVGFSIIMMNSHLKEFVDLYSKKLEKEFQNEDPVCSESRSDRPTE